VDARGALEELYGRLPPLARESVEGLTPDELVQRAGPRANTVAWLVWHAARVQDHHVGELLDVDQVWTEDDWAHRFGLDPDPSNTGYGHSVEDVARVVPSSTSDLLDYFDAVQKRTTAFLKGLSEADLDAVVDRRWEPPVTMGVRLVSIADDSLQHFGQACFVRGLLGH
jgi:hypothetical protein